MATLRSHPELVTDDEARLEAELEFRKALAKRIQTLRKRAGIGQDEFAFRAGIHRTHVGMLENAKIDPKLSTLSRVANALSLDIWQLLRLEAAPAPSEAKLKPGPKRSVRQHRS